MLRKLAISLGIRGEEEDAELEDINAMLAAGKDMILPQGYKKVVERVIVEHQSPLANFPYSVSKAYTHSYAIVLDLIEKNFGTKHCEKYVEIKEVVKAKKVIQKESSAPKIRIQKSFSIDKIQKKEQ